MALPTVSIEATTGVKDDSFLPTFPCKACGVCCKKLFGTVRDIEPSAANFLRDMDRGDGFCKHLSESTNKCRIYDKRPWFCNGVEIWKRYYKPQGLPLEFAYAVMEKQCKILAVKETVLEDDIDWAEFIASV